MHDLEPKPPWRERLSRPSLRRKSFLLVLALALIPSALTLVGTTAAAAKAIRLWITEEVRENLDQRARHISLALDRAIGERDEPLNANVLAEIIVSPPLAPLVLERDSLALHSAEWGWMPPLHPASPFMHVPPGNLRSETGEGGSRLIAVPDQPRTLYVAKPLQLVAPGEDTPHEAHLVRRLELDPVMRPLYNAAGMIVVLALVLTTATGLFGVWFSGYLVTPIRRLRYAFKRLEDGNLDYRVDLERDDELGELASSMNRMAGALQDSYGELARKINELNEQARRIRVSYEVAKAINRSLELQKILADVIREMRQLVPADLVIAGLNGEDPEDIVVAYGWPESQTYFPVGKRIRLENALASRTHEPARPMLFQIEPGTPGSMEERALAGFGGRHLCVMPLATTSGPVGVLWFGTAEPLQERELELLQLLSPSLATAVEHGRLYQRQADFAGELERKVQERTRALWEAQEQLLRTEKLAATGEVAANLAHEINNPLSTIKNYLRLLRRTVRADEQGNAGLHFIGEEIDRIARIVGQLRQLHLPSSAEYTDVDVNQDLKRLAELFHQTFRRRRVELILNLDPNLGKVPLCEDYVRQIVVNLLRNALDASPPAGKVWIRTMRGKPSPSDLTILVKDTGPGISPDIAPRIFNPFFTTKKEGKGSGLGLSVSYGLARRMDGTIDFHCPDEGGAEFSLILPLSPKKPANQASPAKRDPVQRTGDRIIIG